MRNIISVGLVALVLMTQRSSYAIQSLEEEFGSSRVKVQRITAPQDIGKSKRNSAAANYEAAKQKCQYETDRHKDYCLREAKQAYRAAEYKIHAAEKNE